MFKGTKSAIQEAVTLSKMLPKDEVSDPIVASLIKKLEESQGMSEAEFFAGLSQTEVDAFIDYINPKKADGTRTLTNEAYVRSREDLGSLKKIIMTCQTMRARNGDEKALANQRNTAEVATNSQNGTSFIHKFGRFVKSKVFTAVVTGALVLTTVASAVLGISLHNVKNDYRNLESSYNYVLDDMDRAYDALKEFGVDISYDQNSSLADVISSIAEGTKKQHKAEVDQAYALVVKTFEDNGITLDDIYNDETGEYDVSKLDSNMGTVLSQLMKNTKHLQTLEKQVGSTLQIVQIPKRDEAGNPIREDGEIVYKTIEDYESLGDAIADIGNYYHQSLDSEIASIGSVVDQNLTKLGAKKSVKDFKSINAAIDYLGDVGGSKIKDLQTELAGQADTISSLRQEIGGLKSDYEAIMTVNQELQQKIKDLQDQKTANDNQNVSDGSSKGDVADPVDGEEKDDSNNSGKHQDVPGDGNGSGGSPYNDDENDL